MKVARQIAVYERLRDKPLWSLLAARNAPIVLSLLQAHLMDGAGRVPQSILYERIERDLEELRGAGVDIPQRAQLYVADWLSAGYLERTFPVGAIEEEYEISAAAAQAIRFVESNLDRRATATESRLSAVIEQLVRLIEETDTNKSSRISSLLHARERIDNEIARVESGDFKVLNEQQALERVREVIMLTQELVADFRRVRDEFDILNRDLREKLLEETDNRGDVLEALFAGQEGKFVTSRQLRDRLFRELETNVSLRVDETDSTDTFMVSGRGELHLGILIETMRREGFEFQVSRPEVILREIKGQQCEPFEKLIIDVPEEFTGAVIQELGPRRAEMQHMHVDRGQALLEFAVPTRGLIGFRSEFLRLTKGNGVMNHAFTEYRPWCGDIARQRNGVLVAWEEGVATAYAIQQAEDRGVYFIIPGVRVYGGMIVGEHNRPQDLDINVAKAKKLSNVRSNSDVMVTLQAPIEMTLEQCLEYIEGDELVEVTPQTVRMRKRVLSRTKNRGG